MSAVLAIDPGLHGAWALLRQGQLADAGDLPQLGEGAQSRLSGALLASLVSEFKPDLAIIEQVAAMPKQGVSSMFRFGRACGCVEGILAALAVPVHYVSPGRWKLHFRLAGKLNGGAEQARQRAVERWPSKAALFARKKDHGRADAALIGLWFLETQSAARPMPRPEPVHV